MFAEVICALAQQVPFATRVCPCGQLNCGGGCGGGGSEVGGGGTRCGVGEIVGSQFAPTTFQVGGQHTPLDVTWVAIQQVPLASGI